MKKYDPFENVQTVMEQAVRYLGGEAWRLPYRVLFCLAAGVGAVVSLRSVWALSDIANGKVPGRESDDQIILYSIGGMPVEDVAWGKTVYETALEKGIGTKLNLWDAPYLY